MHYSGVEDTMYASRLSVLNINIGYTFKASQNTNWTRIGNGQGIKEWSGLDTVSVELCTQSIPNHLFYSPNGTMLSASLIRTTNICTYQFQPFSGIYV